MKLLNHLLSSKFLIKDGWKIIEETETFIEYYAGLTPIDHEHYLRTIYYNLLENLEEKIVNIESKPDPIWKNFVNFINLIEEFVYFPTFHRENTENWTDFKLIEKLLDVFDISLRPPNNEHIMGVELYSGKGKDIFGMILKLTLTTFQEAFGHFYKNFEKKKNGNSELENDDIQNFTTNVEMESFFFKNVQRIRHILIQTLHLSKDNNNNNNMNTINKDFKNEKKLIVVLYYLLKTMRKSWKNKDTSYSILIPLLKEILKNYSYYIEEFLGKEYSFGIPEDAYNEVNIIYIIIF